MPVREFPMSLLKPEELSTVAREICKIVLSVSNPDPYLITYTDEIMEKVNVYDERLKKNTLIQPVIDADLKRDGIHKDIVKYVRGSQHHPFDTTISAAANKIYSLLDTHNLQLSSESYAVQSQLINALLIDFEKTEYAGAVTTLNLKNAVDNLKVSQQQFEQLHIDRNKVDSEKALTPVYSLINPIRTVLGELLTVLNTFERRENAKYAETIAHVNELTGTFTANAYARRTRQKTVSEQTANVAAPAAN